MTKLRSLATADMLAGDVPSIQGKQNSVLADWKQLIVVQKWLDWSSTTRQ
jgi:hypothetical protein